jgi:hypothetical protein
MHGHDFQTTTDELGNQALILVANRSFAIGRSTLLSRPRSVHAMTAAPPARDTTRPRARRSLAWAALCFVVGQLALAVAIEGWCPQLRDPLYGDKLRQLRLRLASVPADRPLVLMLGSSRTAHGFDADRLEQAMARGGHDVVAYNFGIPGAGPLTELVTLRRLLADGIRPELLLVEVFPPLLAGQVLPFDFGQFPAERLWPSEIDLVRRYVGPLADGLEHQWLAGWAVPSHTHRFPLQRLLWPALLPVDRYGHLLAKFDDDGCNRLRIEAITAQRRSEALSRAKDEYDDILRGYHVGGATSRALDELLADCRRTRIATALVVMPEGPTFQSWYPPGGLDEVADYVQRLGGKHGALVIDARDWLGEGSFLDSHHLLSLGAERFSGRLGEVALTVKNGLPTSKPALVSRGRPERDTK